MASSASRTKDYLTTREAARRLGVSLTTIQLWVEAGALPAWKTAGGHRRIPHEAVEALLTEQRTAGSARLLQVLVVEDEPVQQELYRLQIPEWSDQIRLQVASDGFEGLIIAGREPPDIIVTDLDMPGMDGFQMIQHLALHLPDLKELIVVTGLSPEDIEARGGLPAGTVVYRKPVPFEQIRQRVLPHVSVLLQGAVRGGNA